MAVRDRASNGVSDQNMTAILRWLCGSGLLDDAALAAGDEVGEVGYVFACAARGDGFADGGEGVGGVELRGEEGAVGGAEFFELLRGEAAAFEAYFVEAVGVAAYAAELMHGAEGADYGVVFDDDVAGESGGVGEDAAVAYLRVVADVGVGHDETVVSQAGDASAACGASGDGDVLADGVVVADLEAGGFAG